MTIGLTGKEFLAASMFEIEPMRPASMGPSIDSAVHWTAPRKLPVPSSSVLSSAKSQVIGIACRANVGRVESRSVNQVQIDEPRSVNLLKAKAKYVATASAYAVAPVPDE